MPFCAEVVFEARRRAAAKRQAVAFYHLSLLHGGESTTLYAQAVTLWCSAAKVQWELGHEAVELIGKRREGTTGVWLHKAAAVAPTLTMHSLCYIRSIYKQNTTQSVRAAAMPDALLAVSAEHS